MFSFLKDKDKTKRVGFVISGGLFSFMGLMCVALGLIFGSGSEDATLTIIFCVIGGLYAGAGVGMFIAFAVTQRRIKLVSMYQNIMNGKKSVSLDGLAKTLGKPQQNVVQDLQFLIAKEYFKYGYIDYEYNLFILAADKLEYDKIKHRHAYKCRSCGATTVLYDGDPMVCSYCGGSLEIFKNK